jgi:hypothetical protein
VVATTSATGWPLERMPSLWNGLKGEPAGAVMSV